MVSLDSKAKGYRYYNAYATNKLSFSGNSVYGQAFWASSETNAQSYFIRNQPKDSTNTIASSAYCKFWIDGNILKWADSSGTRLEGNYMIIVAW